MTIPPPPDFIKNPPLWIDKGLVLFYFAVLARLTHGLLKKPWSGRGALARAHLLCAISFTRFGSDLIVALMACFNPSAVHPFLWLASRSFELCYLVATPMAFAEHAFNLSRSLVLRYTATLLYAALAVLALCNAILGLDGLRTGHYSYFASLSPHRDDFLTYARYMSNLVLALYVSGLWSLMILVTPALRPRREKVPTRLLPVMLTVLAVWSYTLVSAEPQVSAYGAWFAHLQGKDVAGEATLHTKLIRAMAGAIATNLLINLHNEAEGKGTGVYTQDTAEEDFEKHSYTSAPKSHLSEKGLVN